MPWRLPIVAVSIVAVSIAYLGAMLLALAAS